MHVGAGHFGGAPGGFRRSLARGFVLLTELPQDVREDLPALSLQVLFEGPFFVPLGTCLPRGKLKPASSRLPLPALFLLAVLIPPIGGSTSPSRGILDVVHEVGFRTDLEEARRALLGCKRDVGPDLDELGFVLRKNPSNRLVVEPNGLQRPVQRGPDGSRLRGGCRLPVEIGASKKLDGVLPHALFHEQSVAA